jgi:hypothetical protein
MKYIPLGQFILVEPPRRGFGRVVPALDAVNLGQGGREEPTSMQPLPGTLHFAKLTYGC